jgi:putative addiction module component (TIGR02574 family)
MNKATLRKELMELTPAERLDLIGELWDSLTPENVPPLSDEDMQELDRRHEALVRDPSRGSSWEDAKARLLAKYK